MSFNKNIVFFFKIVFFVAILYIIYTQVFSHHNIYDLLLLLKTTKNKGIWILFAVFILQFINWGIETEKFRKILAPKTVLDFKSAFISVYVGNATSIFTPDRLGNFIGRFLVLPKLSKLEVTTATMLGNFTQLIATVSFSFLAIVLFVWFPSNIVFLAPYLLLFVAFVLLVILLLIYFNTSFALTLLSKIKWVKNQQKTILFIGNFSKKELIQILGFAYARYLIFIIQFYLVLLVFGVNLSLLNLFVFIGILYFITTFVPSPMFGNLGTRELTALYLLSNYEQPTAVLLASLFIWLINVIFPSVLGTVFWMRFYDVNWYNKKEKR